MPMNVTEALIEATQTLRSHRIDVPELTARLLLSDVVGCDQAWLAAHSLDQLRADRLDEYRESIRTRCSGVPTQYIRGFQEFYGHKIQVTPDVLIPRPETEHLVEAALERLRPGHCVVDIGTGSGAVAISLAKAEPGAVIAASDISKRALKIAQANADRLSAAVRFCAGDIGNAFRPECFDLVVSNPPYVPLSDTLSLQRELRHEPSIALYGGEDGLRVVERLLLETPRILRPGGWMLAEIGYKSRIAVERMLDRPEWSSPQFLRDLAGIDRVVAVRRSDSRAGA